MKNHKIDMLSILNNNPPKTLEFYEETFLCPLYGMKSYHDIAVKSGSYFRASKIKTPTFFLHGLDDPVIGFCSYDFEVFNYNPNLILGITKFGGHIAHYETIYNNTCWYNTLAM